MRILELRIFNGRNVYTHRSAVRALVDLEDLAGKESCEFPSLNDNLLTWLPGLKSHGCASRKQGGFMGRLQEGTYFGHVLEHIVLELQSMLGVGTKYGKTRATNQPGVYEVVFECKVPEIASSLVDTGIMLIEAALGHANINLRERLLRLRRELNQSELGPSTAALRDAAVRRGISVSRIGKGSLLQLGTGRFQKRIQATLTGNASCIAADIAGDKSLTKEILRAAGIPVPRGRVVGSIDEALGTWAQMGCPVVVKPCDGNQGKGVSLNLCTEEELVEAFGIASRYSNQILIEEYIEGRHYRLLVVGGVLVAASERTPAHVIGDGGSTIFQLIEQLNADPLRGDDHEKPLTRVVIDDVVKSVLGRQGLALSSVPSQGNRVWLRENANLSTGGTAVDVTDLVHPQVATVINRAVRLVGLDVAGVDLVTSDIAQPLHYSCGAIIEINAAPGIRMHHFPVEGQSRDVAAAIIDNLFPSGSKSEVPIVAVTGTNGKTTTTRLIAHVLRQQYGVVGLTTTDGVYLNDQCVVTGDTTGPWSTHVVLSDPSVDIAVLELARGGLLRGGLAYDLSDVAVLTNVTEDHLGQDDLEDMRDLVWVKSLVLEAVREDGYAVINADDPYSLEAMEKVNCQLILFSLQADNIHVRQHLGIGGQAVFVRQGTICVGHGSECTPLIHIHDVPITFSGHALYNVSNALASCAALLGLGVDLDYIRRGLASFLPDARYNPGRQNLFSVGECTVMIDYAHNVAGIHSLVQMARNLTAERLIGVIAAPGDRHSATIYRAGLAAGRGFDRLFIKEDQDKRGRAPGEVAEILRQAAIDAGMHPRFVSVYLQELDAVRAAIASARSGDMVIILYEKLAPTMSILHQISKELDMHGRKTCVVAGVVEPS